MSEVSFVSSVLVVEKSCGASHVLTWVAVEVESAKSATSEVQR
jgi:hypothetical protein